MVGGRVKDSFCGAFRKCGGKWTQLVEPDTGCGVTTRQTTAPCAWDDSIGTPGASALTVGMLSEGCP